MKYMQSLYRGSSRLDGAFLEKPDTLQIGVQFNLQGLKKVVASNWEAEAEINKPQVQPPTHKTGPKGSDGAAPNWELTLSGMTGD